MDLVLLPDFRGRGLGTRVVRAMASFVLSNLQWRRFTVDPEITNERAINFWTKVGFIPTGVDSDGDHPRLLQMEWPISDQH